MNHLTNRVVAFRDARDWAQFHGIKDEVLSLVIEAGELAEHFRWHSDDALRAKVAADPEPVADELADVLYWTLLIAHDLGIDLRRRSSVRCCRTNASTRSRPRAGAPPSTTSSERPRRPTGAAVRRSVRAVPRRRVRRVDRREARTGVLPPLPLSPGHCRGPQLAEQPCAFLARHGARWVARPRRSFSSTSCRSLASGSTAWSWVATPRSATKPCVVELKQWDRTEASEAEQCVVTQVGRGLRDVLHPSVQVGQYAQYLADYHTAFSEQGVGLAACAYLHNLRYDAADELFSTKHRAALDTYPLFTGDGANDLVDYLMQRMAGGEGDEVLDRVLQAPVRPSRKLLLHTAAMIEGQDVFTLLDEQLVVFESVLAAAREGGAPAGKTTDPRTRRSRHREVGGGAPPGRAAREGWLQRAARDRQQVVHRERTKVVGGRRGEPVQVLQQLRRSPTTMRSTCSSWTRRTVSVRRRRRASPRSRSRAANLRSMS